MTDQAKDGVAGRDASRRPRVFRVDDPTLVRPAEEAMGDDGATDREGGFSGAGVDGADGRPMGARALLDRGIGWGGILLAALTAAASLSLGLWFWRLVSVGLERDDAIGWTMRGLVGIAILALTVLLLRELIGLLRLRRLAGLRRDVAAALAGGDVRAERAAADRLIALYGERAELKWAVDRVRSHRGDVLDAGGLMTLVERELVREVDGQARRAITASSKRVATVTAMSPLTSIAFIYLVFEALRLLRKVATLYGGRPGFGGSLRLGRTVVGNLIAAGGVALTDDLIGQFIGQDLVRRLSRRLGEGVFNGALIARIGVAALDVVRPVPFLEGNPVRVRDIVGEVFRSPPFTSGVKATK